LAAYIIYIESERSSSLSRGKEVEPWQQAKPNNPLAARQSNYFTVTLLAANLTAIRVIDDDDINIPEGRPSFIPLCQHFTYHLVVIHFPNDEILFNQLHGIYLPLCVFRLLCLVIERTRSSPKFEQ
jgi:hypothetical protein